MLDTVKRFVSQGNISVNRREEWLMKEAGKVKGEEEVEERKCQVKEAMWGGMGECEE